jgi:carboxypeptidase C (cathepsin A)
MNFQTLDGARGNDLPYVSFLPTYAAVAWYHKKLAPKWLNSDVRTVTKEAEKFAEGDYALALQRGSSLSPDEETRIVKRLSELTGLKEPYLRASHLRVPEFRFFKELLRDEGKTTGRYDARLTGTDSLSIGEYPEYDASDAATTPVFYSCINDYLPNELGYVTDLRYRIFNPEGHWDNDVEEGYPDTSDDLRRAINQNPYMKLMFACGWYDLACPYFGTHYTINHMDLSPKQLANVSWQFYPAGHMMYIERSSREKLVKDITSFIAGAK